MGLKLEGERLCFESGILSSTVYLSLHSANPTAANEISGNGYSRLAVASGAWSIQNGRATNSQQLNLFTPTADFTTAATHAALFSALAGGNLLYSTTLRSGSVTFENNANIYFSAGSLEVDIDITNGLLTVSGKALCLQGGLVAGQTYLSLHTALPTDGNELTGGNYSRASVPIGAWDIRASDGRALTVANVDFPVPSANWGQVTYVALSFQQSGSNRLYVDQIGPPSPPSILAHANPVRVSSGQMYIDLQTD